MLFMTVLVVFAIVFVIVEFAYSIHLLVGIAVESILIAIGLAQKSLGDAALDVYRPLVAGEFTEARTKLSWIVGRDTDKLDESEIVTSARLKRYLKIQRTASRRHSFGHFYLVHLVYGCIKRSIRSIQ